MQATPGDQTALREALDLETEARRRFAEATTLAAPLAALPVSRRPWWRFR